MNATQFKDSILNQIARSKARLFESNAQYTPDEDKLENFRTAAALQHITPMQALHGMRAKHTVSVYDMVRSGKQYPLAVWTEKITDDINYLLLLKALVDEDADNQAEIEASHTPLFEVNGVGVSLSNL